jgi:hypothetical protein
MPQYSFYTVPENAKSMTFGQLFADCYRQLHWIEWTGKFDPLIIGNTLTAKTSSFEFNLVEIAPEPLFLGDLMKILNGTWSYIHLPLRPSALVLVEDPLKDEATFSKLLPRIQEWIISPRLRRWTNAMAGEIEAYWSTREAATDKRDDTLARRLFPSVEAQSERDMLVLMIWAHASSSKSIMEARKATFTLPVRRENFFRLLCLVSCGIGISAFEWSKQQHLQPVFVVYRNERIPAMVPISVLEKIQSYQFHLVEVESLRVSRDKRFTLLAIPSEESGIASITTCLFPPEWICARGFKFWIHRLKSKMRLSVS